MSGQEEAKLVSRRRVVSLLALAAAAGFGALTASDAEAQTTSPGRRDHRDPRGHRDARDAAA